jgi:branched-chain amino acid transport system permease protein
MQQAIVSGLTQGAAYALVAVGLALVYSVSRTINLAHGAFVVLGIMLVQALVGPVGLVGAIVVALVLGAAAAAGMEVLAVRRVADAPPLSGLLLTLGLAFAFQGLLRVVFGPDEFSSEPFTASRSVDVLGATIPAQAFWLIGVAVVVSIGLELIVARTFIGRTLVACAQDPAGARLCGIPVARVRAGTYALAGALGVLAGVLLGPLTFVTYESAISFALLGLIAAALGGLGSLRGAVLGGVFLGLAESLAVTYVSSQMKTPITFAVLLVLLTLRPRGFVRGVTA